MEATDKVGSDDWVSEDRRGGGGKGGANKLKCRALKGANADEVGRWRIRSFNSSTLNDNDCA